MVLCTLATANARIFSGIRLRKIEVWASVASVGALAIASVEWLSEQGPSSVASDVALGTAELLHVTTTPPRASLAGFWSYQGISESTVLCNLVFPNNAIVDIEFEAIMQNGESAVNVVTTNSNTTGVLYMMYLGGPTTSLLAPVSYAATY